MRANRIAIAALIFLASCVPAPKAPMNPSTREEKGFQVFMREGCFSSCHVETIALDRPKSISGFVPDLRRTPRRTRDWYLAYFVNPRALLPYSPMPSYGYLSDDELEALVAFLQRLNREVLTPPVKLTLEEAVPDTPRNLTAYSAGRMLYRTYCAGCHGESGDGGGPMGHLLSPEPRDFTDVVWMSKQTELYLFSIATNGKPNTAMPAFKEILNPAGRAVVVRYVHYFADPVAQERMELSSLAARLGHEIPSR